MFPHSLDTSSGGGNIGETFQNNVLLWQNRNGGDFIMKKIASLILAVLLVGAVTMFTACSNGSSSGSDDDNKKVEKPNGKDPVDPADLNVFADTTWKSVTGPTTHYLSFYADYTFHYEIHNTEDDAVTMEMDGTYTVNGNTAILKELDEEYPFTINEDGVTAWYGSAFTKVIPKN